MQISIAQTPHWTGLRLERLPVELLSGILSALDDLPSLSAATLASRTLHNAFTQAKRAILSSVLVNRVGADVIPDALAAVGGIDATCESEGALLVAPAQVQGLLSEDQVCSVANLSAVVRAFAELFVQSATDAGPEIKTGPRLPSEAELARIERTFYRFETFGNLLRAWSGDLPTFEEKTDSLLSSLAPWEVEQLGCIHDFLFHQIKPAYDDIASHDIEWAIFEVEPALNYACPEVQTIMSSGLASVYRVATAKTYADRHRLLHRRSGPDRNNKFIFWALKRYSSVQSQQDSTRAPFAPGWETDRGPRDAWEWARAGCAPEMEAYRLDRTVLRSWGYVLWDRARLEGISLFKEPFCPPLHVHEEHEVDDEFEASWRARQRLASAGKSGYWSAADQSQIEYHPTTPPRRPVAYRRGWPRDGPTFANAKREFEEASARIEAAMQRKKMGR